MKSKTYHVPRILDLFTLVLESPQYIRTVCFGLESDAGRFSDTTAPVAQCVRPSEEPRAVVLLAIGVV